MFQHGHLAPPRFPSPHLLSAIGCDASFLKCNGVCLPPYEEVKHVVHFQRTMGLASLCGRAQSGDTVALRFGDRRQAFGTHQHCPRPEPSTAASFLTATLRASFFLKNKKGTPQTVRVLSSAYSVIWSFVIRTVGTGEDGCFNHLRIKGRILKTKL